MCKIIPVTLAAAVLLGGAAHALPPAPTIPQLLDICSSATVAEATAKGGRLEWERMDETRIAPWRSSFEHGSGQAVEVVGWSRGPQERDGLLSFWAMMGAGGQRVCSYSARDAARLLDGLSHVLGTPDRQEANGAIASAGWSFGLGQVSFIQVGADALITVMSPR